jgi:hypothetical protein
MTEEKKYRYFDADRNDIVAIALQWEGTESHDAIWTASVNEAVTYGRTATSAVREMQIKILENLIDEMKRPDAVDRDLAMAGLLFRMKIQEGPSLDAFLREFPTEEEKT